ncbi:sialidase family protein [Actinophytocola oryzae]|uniref:BNR repeat protein n=1 Tax=Actinophytocola oryzae TaxID=502181 RepID=A0A4R7UWT4_9PSEU|nr:sialidase family protein [Actinophytocola oryzae]TDV40452.1 BNR repeat protein [Actinophytocola oryzae]
MDSIAARTVRAAASVATAAGLAFAAPSADAATTGIVIATQPQPIEAPHRHSAFPGAALRPDGTLALVWRGAFDHVDHRDGAILRADSYDLGKTWTTPQVILSGQDYRDPYLAYLDGHEYLTYFTGSSTNPAQGAYVSKDSAPAVRVDGGLPFAAISGPVVKLPDGRLGTAFYARKPGETIDTAWMAWSTDQGQTWTSNRILNAIGAGIPTPEPWLVVDGTSIHVFARWGGTQIAVRSSTDSGATWNTARIAITGCNGRPSSVITRTGTIVMVCRDTRGGSRGGAQVAYSLDHTGTWAWGPTLMAAEAGTDVGMSYAAPVETPDGAVAVPFGMERADGSSSLWFTNLAETSTRL